MLSQPTGHSVRPIRPVELHGSANSSCPARLVRTLVYPSGELRNPASDEWWTPPRGDDKGAYGRSRNACRPRAFASSGERTRVISVAFSQSSHRIATSAPPRCARTSSFGTGSEDPQSGHVRPFSCAIRAARRFCMSESRVSPVTTLVYPTPTSQRIRADHVQGGRCTVQIHRGFPG
jgi:hypothetical protein